MKIYACIAILLAAGCATGPTLGKHSPSRVYSSARPETAVTACMVRTFGTPETVTSTQVVGGYFLVAPYPGLDYVEASVIRKAGDRETRTTVRGVRPLRAALAMAIAACM